MHRLVSKPKRRPDRLSILLNRWDYSILGLHQRLGQVVDRGLGLSRPTSGPGNG